MKNKAVILIVSIFIIGISILLSYNFNKLPKEAFLPDITDFKLSNGLNIIAFDLGGDTTKNAIRENGAFGDAVLLEQNGHYLLMDTGTKDSENKTLINYLKKLKVKNFSIYLSHYHEDHYAWIEYLLKDSLFTIEKLYVPHILDYQDLKKNDKKGTYENYYKEPLSVHDTLKKTCKNKNIEMIEIQEGYTISIGEAELKVVWDNYHSNKISSFAPDGLTKGQYINNLSLVSMITYKDIRYFSGGDIEKEMEKIILQSGLDVHADIMKFSHHGSSGSNTSDFIAKVNPKYGFFPNNYISGKNHIMWWAERNNGSYQNYVNSLDDKIQLTSTLYNGNVVYNISPQGNITVKMTRNYSTITFNYMDSSKQSIDNQKQVQVNNKSKSHIVIDDYIEEVDNYVFDKYSNNQSLDNDISSLIINQDVIIDIMYKKEDIISLEPKISSYTGNPIEANIATNLSNLEIKYSYYDGENCSGNSLNDVPINIGNYSVKAYTTGDTEYSEASICVRHIINEKEKDINNDEEVVKNNQDNFITKIIENDTIMLIIILGLVILMALIILKNRRKK